MMQNKFQKTIISQDSHKFRSIRIMFFITIFFLGFFGQAGGAEGTPIVSSVSGAVSHGQNITISGSGFGVKNPAAPLVWDSGNHSDSLNARYCEALPRGFTGDNAAYNIAYRNAPFTSPSGSIINVPHNRDNKIIAGAHACGNAPYIGCGFSTGNNVGLTVCGWAGSKKHFMMYYHRLDPLFPLEASPESNNYKAWESQSTNSMFGSGTGTWTTISTSGLWAPAEKYPDNTCLTLGSSSDNPACWNTCSGVNGASYPNPIRDDVGTNSDGWQHYEWAVLFPTEGGDDGFVDFYTDSTKAISCPNGNVPGNELLITASASIGGFTRVPLVTPNYGWQYFSDVYMDNTFSRVILANNSNYDSATIKEPQIPSVWSDGLVTVKVNLGKLPDTGTAYLFVFDADNNHNMAGYPVTLGSSGDTTPPASPTGLTVN